jgi:hypothetical protein
MRCVIAQKNAILTNCQTAADAGLCHCTISVRAAGVRDTMRWNILRFSVRHRAQIGSGADSASHQKCSVSVPEG